MFEQIHRGKFFAVWPVRNISFQGDERCKMNLLSVHVFEIILGINTRSREMEPSLNENKFLSFRIIVCEVQPQEPAQRMG